ncbi:cobyric acid synthase [Pueribacillus theae]|uniref:Cobyric acid synthase n=1 Tax=Pueribacillus theae TaxID=2171751 RepID=A0A2U1K3Y1_9BACI|nr:cobyric acid synthase [Pueribacillus theae]PWA12221.1 cobyric acid synthase [Pueribacillus theae]
MKGIMLQGTSSDVGKSVLSTAICRILANKGYAVAPFKSQNMSNKTSVTVDGKEIARSQFLQAEAAKVVASAYMNPIVLKPKSDRISDVILLGEKVQTYSGSEYREKFYERGIAAIKESLANLEKEFDLVVIEGAGSPVEMNLNDRELVNMKVAEIADVPVILIADIERGGVFASLVGTMELFTKEQLARVKGIIINKFRGEIDLFYNGKIWLEKKLNLPILGVVPTFEQINIEAEDSLSQSPHEQMNSFEQRELAYEQFAAHVARHLDIEQIIRTMNEWGKQ